VGSIPITRSNVFWKPRSEDLAVGARTLRTIIGWGCASLLGALGWWLGEQMNLGAAVILGAVASGVGLYYGHKWFDNNLR
jgi:hypothetical protein